MPRVTVILDNGHEVKVEGANFAQWARNALVTGGNAANIGARNVFEVAYKDENTTKILARFDSAKVVGYVLDES